MLGDQLNRLQTLKNRLKLLIMVTKESAKCAILFDLPQPKIICLCYALIIQKPGNTFPKNSFQHSESTVLFNPFFPLYLIPSSRAESIRTNAPWIFDQIVLLCNQTKRSFRARKRNFATSRFLRGRAGLSRNFYSEIQQRVRVRRKVAVNPLILTFKRYYLGPTHRNIYHLINFLFHLFHKHWGYFSVFL